MPNREVSVTGFDLGSQLVGTSTYGVDGESKLHSVYGIASHPYIGCIGMKIHTNIDRESSAVFVDNPNIPVALANTEVATFNPVSGCYIHYTQDGSINVVAPKDLSFSSAADTAITAENITIDATNLVLNCDTLTINCPSITINGAILVNGSLQVVDGSSTVRINTSAGIYV
jgi:phage baseplate assembly protein gpV